MSVVIVLGILAVVVSLWDKFGTPRYRPYRALVFIVFGLSGIAPATHYAVENGRKCLLRRGMKCLWSHVRNGEVDKRG